MYYIETECPSDHDCHMSHPPTNWWDIGHAKRDRSVTVIHVIHSNRVSLKPWLHVLYTHCNVYMVWYKRLSHLYAHTKDSTIVHYVTYASTVQYTYARKYILHFMTGQIATVPACSTIIFRCIGIRLIMKNGKQINSETSPANFGWSLPVNQFSVIEFLTWNCHFQ